MVNLFVLQLRLVRCYYLLARNKSKLMLIKQTTPFLHANANWLCLFLTYAILFVGCSRIVNCYLLSLCVRFHSFMADIKDSFSINFSQLYEFFFEHTKQGNHFLGEPTSIEAKTMLHVHSRQTS